MSHNVPYVWNNRPIKWHHMNFSQWNPFMRMMLKSEKIPIWCFESVEATTQVCLVPMGTPRYPQIHPIWSSFSLWNMFFLSGHITAAISCSDTPVQNIMLFMKIPMEIPILIKPHYSSYYILLLIAVSYMFPAYRIISLYIPLLMLVVQPSWRRPLRSVHKRGWTASSIGKPLEELRNAIQRWKQWMQWLGRRVDFGSRYISIVDYAMVVDVYIYNYYIIII